MRRLAEEVTAIVGETLIGFEALGARTFNFEPGVVGFAPHHINTSELVLDVLLALSGRCCTKAHVVRNPTRDPTTDKRVVTGDAQRRVFVMRHQPHRITGDTARTHQLAVVSGGRQRRRQQHSPLQVIQLVVGADHQGSTAQHKS